MKNKITHFLLVLLGFFVFESVNAQNMNKWITLTVSREHNIQLSLKAVANNTIINIVCGSTNQTITVDTNWTGSQNYFAESNTMTIYGDLTGFDCSNNNTKITAIDVSNNADLVYLNCSVNNISLLNLSNNTVLSYLDCSINNISVLDVSNNFVLAELRCSGNNLSACALDNLFRSLYNRFHESNSGKVFITDGNNSTNPGAINCQQTIATVKNWQVKDQNNNLDVVNTVFTCITTVQTLTATIIDTNSATLYAQVNIRGNDVITSRGFEWRKTIGGTFSDLISNQTTNNYSATLNGLIGYTSYTYKAFVVVNGSRIYGQERTFSTILDTNVNMSKRIVLTVTPGYYIQLSLMAQTNNTHIKIVSGSTDQIITIDTNWTSFLSYYAGCDTMTIYGDLQKFNCSENYSKLTAIDVSNNNTLTYLDCYVNSISSLDVSNNIALTQLNCYGNNLSACALDDLFRSLHNRISDTISGKVYIQNASFGSNPGVSSCKQTIATVKNWEVKDQFLNSDIVNTVFYCVHSVSTLWTKYIDTSSLAIFNAIINRVGNDTITSRGFEWKKTVGGTFSDLISSDTTDFYSVSLNGIIDSTLYTYKAFIVVNGSRIYGQEKTFSTIVDTSKWITLTVTQGQNIKFSLIGKGDNTPIKIVSGSTNQIITADSNFIYYQPYYAGSNIMTIYGDVKRIDCNCNFNNLTAIDISKNTTMTGLSCSGNNISSLNLSNNIALKELVCSVNNLSSLDLSHNTALTFLNCAGNNLPLLDVSHNTALTFLDCQGDNLSSLDVSHNTALIELWCSNNNLSYLDVSNNIVLNEITCEGNNLSACALDELFHSLPDRISEFHSGEIYIKRSNSLASNPGTYGCNTTIANAKKWKVLDGYYDSEIRNSVFTCSTSVETLAASQVRNTSAKLNGVVYIMGDEGVTSRGFEWKASSEGTYQDLISFDTTNLFSAQLNNLTPNSNYTFKSFVVIDSIRLYGIEKTFQTNQLNIIVPEVNQIIAFVYPNPVKNTLNIKCSETIENIILTDISGRIVIKGKTQKNLDCSKLTKGIYILNIQTKKGNKTFKLLKE